MDKPVENVHNLKLGTIISDIMSMAKRLIFSHNMGKKVAAFAPEGGAEFVVDEGKKVWYNSHCADVAQW